MKADKDKWFGQIHIQQFNNASTESNPFWIRSDELGVQSFTSQDAAKKHLREMADYARRVENDEKSAAQYEAVLTAVEQF